MTRATRPIPAETIRTRRLVLRPLGPGDEAGVAAAVDRRDIAENTSTLPWPYDIEDARTFIATRPADLESGRGIVWPVREQPRETILGMVGLHVEPMHDRAEVGYWLSSAARGRGLATEAARAAVDFGFGRLGLHRIHAGHFAHNPASGRVLEKLGFRREGVLRHHYLRFGRWCDLHVMAILHDEWDAAFTTESMETR